MRAIRQTILGGPDVLELTEVQRPEPGPTEVLVHVTAAALPMGGLTAWQALVETAHVGPRDRVLINGAAGESDTWPSRSRRPAVRM